MNFYIRVRALKLKKFLLKDLIMSYPYRFPNERKPYYLEPLLIFWHSKTKEDKLARTAWLMMILGCIISIWVIFISDLI